MEVASLTLDLPAAKGLNKPQVQLRWSTGAFEKLGKELAVTTRDFKNVFQSESRFHLGRVDCRTDCTIKLSSRRVARIDGAQTIHCVCLVQPFESETPFPTGFVHSGIDREPARPFFVPMASSEPAEVMRSSSHHLCCLCVRNSRWLVS